MNPRGRLLVAAAVSASACSLAPPAGGSAEAPGQGTARLLGRVAAPRAELVSAKRLAVPGGGAIERYRQRVGGLPVLGAEAVVATPDEGAPILVTDHTVPAVSAPAPARISRSRAIAAARVATGAGALRGRLRAKLGIDRRSGRAAWEVVIPSGRPLADFVAIVDARSGRALRTRDALRHLTGSASLYVPNPVVTQRGYTAMVDRDDHNSRRLTALRVPVTLEHLTSPRGCLVGTYASVHLGKGKRTRPVCSPSLDFTDVTRGRDAFEALMAYFHIDRTRTYVDSLGLTQPLRSQPQIVDVDSFSDDNSFFSPANRHIAFGTGGVDDAEDGDVVVHEYGHALQDQAVHFFGETLEGASMGEGFGDYIAAVMSARSTGGSSRFDPCMFEWDATSYTDNKCLRRTDRRLTKTQGDRRCLGDPHCMGEAWSGALWDLRSALGFDDSGRSIGDRVVLESHFLLSTRAKFVDGARALLAADSLLNGGVNFAAITDEMVARGFCRASGC